MRMPMNDYQVLIHGKNFLVSKDSISSKHGFYTNIYVRAENERQAELAAVEVLRINESLRKSVQNREDDPPRVFAEEIQEISNYDNIQPKQQGITWYEEKESENA